VRTPSSVTLLAATWSEREAVRWVCNVSTPFVKQGPKLAQSRIK
jgi:hypothetical protein